MFQLNPESVWKEERFIERENAVTLANDLFTRGFVRIKLLHKTWNGWVIEKEVKQHAGVAKAKQAAQVQAAIDDSNEYFKKNGLPEIKVTYHDR